MFEDLTCVPFSITLDGGISNGLDAIFSPLNLAKPKKNKHLISDIAYSIIQRLWY